MKDIVTGDNPTGGSLAAVPMFYVGEYLCFKFCSNARATRCVTAMADATHAAEAVAQKTIETTQTLVSAATADAKVC